MKPKVFLTEAAKGAVTGASMLVPGVSGGTMALIFGFYDKIVNAAASFFKNPKKNFGILLFYMFFIGFGFVLFANVMTFLLEYIELPMYSFFIGAILGSIPLLIKKAGLKKIEIYDVLFFLLGVLFVIGLSNIPENIFDFNDINGIFKPLHFIVSGALIAVALVLPGISVSHMLLILGVYENILIAIKSFDIMFLLPIALSVIIGVFCFIKLLEYTMKTFTRQTFMIITGFVIASAGDIFERIINNNIPQGINIVFCIFAIVLGIAATFFISRFSD